MKQYIDKSAVISEIDRIQNTTMDKNKNFTSSYDEGKFDALTLLENYINTLEVKEFANSARTCKDEQMSLRKDDNTYIIEAITPDELDAIYAAILHVPLPYRRELYNLKTQIEDEKK